MDKITLRQFYDTSGDYKVVRCKTFEQAKKFWQESQKIGRLKDLKTEEALKRLYYDEIPEGTNFCFSDEEWYADDDYYKDRVIYEFEDIKIPKSRNNVKDKLYKVIEECDIDLLVKEVDILVESILKNFELKEK